jgi:prevent-host-death family protein
LEISVDSVGAFEAKTNLSRLLERARQGETIAITRRGEAVAHLVPPPGVEAKANAADAIARWRQTRQGLRLDGLRVRDLIDEGRR